MKRLAAAIISALILVCTVSSGTVFAFQDLNETEKAAILDLKEWGFVSGVDSDHFAPRDKINYAQGVSFIVKGLKLSADSHSSATEPDVSENFSLVPKHAWYSEAFAAAKANGLNIQKDVDPNAIMTKEQYKIMLKIALDQEGPFPDMESPIVFENDDKMTITRGEAAVLLHKTIKFVENHTTPTKKGYAFVNGLEMYYEIHGKGQPLVLLHGAYSSINTSFGKLIPILAKTRQVIAVDLQGHGHTADIDRPLSYVQMADDTSALLSKIGITNADVFGYSIGGSTALQIAIRHPELVRKLVLASAYFRSDGYYPEVLDTIPYFTPEVFAGSPIEEEYKRVAPNPQDFPKLVEKLKNLVSEKFSWEAETIRSIKAPALILAGDSDSIRPEHALELFRLFGGGVVGDMAGLPDSQLALLPSTTHISILEKTDSLISLIVPFLDAPFPGSK
jgi:pimeloyl-ACP methyl ester carboxylesterase